MIGSKLSLDYPYADCNFENLVNDYLPFSKSLFIRTFAFLVIHWSESMIFIYDIEMFLWSLMWEPFAINDDLIVSSKSRVKSSILPIPDKHFSFAIARTQIRLIRTETWSTCVSSNHVTLEFLFLFWSELSISTIKYANLNFIFRQLFETSD